MAEDLSVQFHPHVWKRRQVNMPLGEFWSHPYGTSLVKIKEVLYMLPWHFLFTYLMAHKKWRKLCVCTHTHTTYTDLKNSMNTFILFDLLKVEITWRECFFKLFRMDFIRCGTSNIRGIFWRTQCEPSLVSLMSRDAPRSLMAFTFVDLWSQTMHLTWKINSSCTSSGIQNILICVWLF